MPFIRADQPSEPAANVIEAPPPVERETVTPVPAQEPEATGRADGTKIADGTEPLRAEVLALYRRLHVALDEPARSELLLELMSDERVEFVLLGFDLASRDLSSGASLGEGIADRTVALMEHASPTVRDQATRLVTRLSLPDAMQILAIAIEDEGDPAVARSILSGLRRWPTPSAAKNILRWFRVNSDAREAASGAAWALQEINGWTNASDRELIAARLRETGDGALTPSDLNLIATMGDEGDLERLITMLSAREESRADAARALVLTPLGVEPLIAAAAEDPDLAPQASEALLRHRVDADGLATLAGLGFRDSETRAAALRRMSSRLDPDARAAGVVGLVETQRIDGSLARELLRTLLAPDGAPSAPVAGGLVTLAELELDAKRPDKTLEAASAARSTGTLGGDLEQRAAALHAIASILTGAYDAPVLAGAGAGVWMEAFARAPDDAVGSEIAREAIARDLDLRDEQRQVLERAAGTPDEPAPGDTPEADEDAESGGP